VYNHDWTSYTDYTVGGELPSVISPMAIAGPPPEPPEPPTLVAPENFSVKQPLQGHLVWEPAARADFYDVYLGTTDPPTNLIGRDLTDITCAYVVPDAKQTYFWEVVAKSGRSSTSSLVWSFTTGNQPGLFCLSTPANGALGVPIEGDLTWQASDRATSYEVTLGSNTYTTSTNSYHYSVSYGTSYTWNVTATNADGNTISSNGPFSFSTTMEKMLTDCLYWKCGGSAFLWQTDKTGQNPVQVRSAAWLTDGSSQLAPMNPDGAAIFEMPHNCYFIRKHDAVSGSYVDMYTGYSDWCGGAVGCDNNYVYMYDNDLQNAILKFRMSDGSRVSWTYIDCSVQCVNFGVMNDTVWVGDGSGYLYAYPTSWMDGGNHSAARKQYIGGMAGTPMGMTWDGTYYYIAGSPNALRVYNHDWTSYTDYTVGGELPSVISPMAVCPGVADVGVAEILEPSGLIDTLQETPHATVHNFGTTTCSFDVWYEIRDSATSALRYKQSATVTSLAPGENCDPPFPDWVVPKHQEGRYYAKCYTALAGDIDPTNDTARSQFAVEGKQQGPPGWTQWADVPGGRRHQDLDVGACMATDPGGFYVYLLKGNNTREFYRYDPAIGEWTALESMPGQDRHHCHRFVREGAILAQVDGKFYATRGGNCMEFWEYDPAADSGYHWTQKADVPGCGHGLQWGASAAGVKVGNHSYVYLLKASESFEFCRYNVEGDSWEAMAPAPGRRGEEFKTGSCITYDGVDTIFALKGTHNNFYAYVVSTNSWQARTSLPVGRGKQAKGGAAICYHLRKVYCIKGSNSQEFWVYNCADNTWIQGADIPLGQRRCRVQDGGALVYCRASRYLFATKGNSLEFWSYGHLSNYGQQSSEEVIALGAGVNTYGLATASVLVPGRDRVCFALPKPGIVSLKLYDMTGRVARVLANGWHPQGRHEVSLSAQDLARGVYILKLQGEACNLVRKVVIE
jgi:hypothetical protein